LNLVRGAAQLYVQAIANPARMSRFKTKIYTHSFFIRFFGSFVFIRLGRGAAQLYVQAIANPAGMSWFKKAVYPWPLHCQYQCHSFAAAALFWHAKYLLAECKYGQVGSITLASVNHYLPCIAFATTHSLVILFIVSLFVSHFYHCFQEIAALRESAATLKRAEAAAAAHAKKRGAPLLASVVQSSERLRSLVDARLKLALKDNDSVYFASIPPPGEINLDSIESKIMVSLCLFVLRFCVVLLFRAFCRRSFRRRVRLIVPNTHMCTLLRCAPFNRRLTRVSFIMHNQQVKSVDFQSLLLPPNEADPFATLVSPEVKRETERFQQMVSASVTTAVHDGQMATQTAQASLSSLGLPAALEATHATVVSLLGNRL
jgi:hypothetical protein